MLSERCVDIYRVFLDKSDILRENVPEVKLYRCNQTYPKLNGYGDNGEISFKRMRTVL
jgi:hypothetical protein